MLTTTTQDIENLENPGDRFVLQECIGSGIFANVHLAIDNQLDGKKVAIKIQKLTPENEIFIQEEYNILKNLTTHPNLPTFYGAYKTKNDSSECIEIWFVMEFCEGGPVTDLVVGLQTKNRRMTEEHIAFILREIIKALIHLHNNMVLHRDIKGSNILLTKEGEIKVVDFGLSRELDGPLGKRYTCIGSPCWMPPEVVTSDNTLNEEIVGYGNRCDVWSLGIVAIELADGKAPFQDVHPTRAMFQIIRNPPPGLYRPANWTQIYNDFIAECLEKNPEHRPFMAELLDHPFFENIPENDYYLAQELKQLAIEFSPIGRKTRKSECIVQKKLLKTSQDSKPELMYVEDLAALEDINEDTIIHELEERMKLGHFQTYVGDVLLILNPNERPDIYGIEFHAKYKFKSRSDYSPHIYGVADGAYQDVLHHEENQHILLSGETLSGKTTAMIHLVEHLVYLGQSMNTGIGQQVLKALGIIHSFTNASTTVNPNSTRCILKNQITFGATGKISGAIFTLHQLEKWRVSSTDMNQANFHILYYFYDAMAAENKLKNYKLNNNQKYRYLRIPEKKNKSSTCPRDNPKMNFKQFLTIQQNLLDIGIDENEIDTILTTLSAILNLGNVQFKDIDNKIAEIENIEIAEQVAKLLKIDEKKFCWSLTNYCYIKNGIAERRKHTGDEARDARDILANNIYSRLVDWIVSLINFKLSFGRVVFGDKYSINIVDMFGFECYKRNRMEQLFVNCINEQMQYHYTQRVFAWEMLEQQEEHVPSHPLSYFNNKLIIDELMNKPNGLLSCLDDASKQYKGYQYIIDNIRKTSKRTYIKVMSNHEFVISHYTGTLIYDSREMTEKNRDFLPPEMIDILRMSKDINIQKFFTNPLTKTGNLIIDQSFKSNMTRKAKWGTALIKENQKTKKIQFSEQSEGYYSQTRQMRTATSVFRSVSAELLQNLAIGPGNGGTHFVRCLRSDLTGRTRGFNSDIVKQQLKALSVVDTAKARQKGFPHRIPFNEFLRRYQFLAFDFDENVEITKENCRLLLIRLKMEGWAIGKSKVFLKYYNEEYLARLYETQVKKIIKVQCMMRAFLAKRNVATKLKKVQKMKQVSIDYTKELEHDSAALVIQKAYRGYSVRKIYGPLINKTSGDLDEDTAEFLKPYVKRWRSKTIFQVILKYRAARYQDIVYLSQQVHIYNQIVMKDLQLLNNAVSLERIDPKENLLSWLGNRKPSVWKIPFRFDELPYFDTTYMCDFYQLEGKTSNEDDTESWDTPLRWRNTIANQVAQSLNIHDDSKTSEYFYKHNELQHMTNMPFCRDPMPPSSETQSEQQFRSRSPSSSSICRGFSNSPVQKSSEDIQITSNKIDSPVKTTTSSSRTSLNHNFDCPKSPSKIVNYEFEFNRTPLSTPSKLIINKPKTLTNPIKELEIICRRNSSGNISEDDPPYNFQSMLRKTNYNRDSMKRTKSEICVPISEYRSSTPPKQIDTSYEDFPEPEKIGSSIVFTSNNNINNQTSCTYNEYDHELYPKNSWTTQTDNLLNINGNIDTEIITTELIPGVIAEGKVFDL